MAQNEKHDQQPMPAPQMAVVFARALAKVDLIHPKALGDPIRDLLENALESIVGANAKRELPAGILRVFALAQALVDAPADPAPGTGVFAPGA